MTDNDWANFKTAYQRITDAEYSRRQYGTEAGLGCADGLEWALVELEDAFRHTHVASGDGDKCALCDLDIRNDIHERAAS